MLLDDVDRKLDMLCIIGLRLRNPWFEMASNIPGSISARIGESSGSMVLQFLFQKRKLSRNAIATIRANPSAIEEENHYLVSENINDEGIKSVLDEGMAIKSVILSGSYLEEGELRLRYRFHNSDTGEISRLIGGVRKLGDASRVIYLGPSRGIKANLEDIALNVPLSAVKFRIRMANLPHSVSADGKPVEYIGESEVREAKGKKPKVILYSSDHVDWPEPISESDNIYLLDAIDPFTLKLSASIQDKGIPVMASFGRITGSMLELAVILPTPDVEDYMNALLSLGSVQENKPELVLSMPLVPETWGLL